MYEVSANINNVPIRKVPLTRSYQLDLERLDQTIDGNTKMIFLCSPNNPTGNSLNREDVEALLNNYYGIVVVDEAYINFSRYRSFSQELKEYPNLVVMQTLSKAWGLAALRLGMAFASVDIVNVMNKIKPPYNINQASQELALQALNRVDEVNEMIREIVKERKILETELPNLQIVKKVHPSDGNFLLVQVTSPVEIYHYLLDKGIVVRDRSRVELCEGCLRITVGTPSENKTLLRALDEFQAQ
jgi:histidinol-phosphate aminotransferase